MEQGYIFINNNVFPTLLAISTDEQQNGLMYQEWPPPIMSFIYAMPSVNRFWMKNTPSPLDIVFCYKGKVSEICYGEPHSTHVVGSHMSDLVIEFPYGTVENNEIKIGHSAGIITPTTNDLNKIMAEKTGLFVKF